MPYDWIKRMYWALEMPQALKAFLSREVGSRVIGEPPALLAVHMQATRDMNELVDTTGLGSLPDGIPHSHAFGYFVGTPFGKPWWKATNKMISHMLSYALAVESDSLHP